MKENNNLQNSKEYCKIREIKPRDENDNPIETKKLVLHLGSFLHRTSFAAGDIPWITNSFGASFVTVDWPKMEFDEEKVLMQIHDYIKENNDKEFIISWLSFWEIVARKLFARLWEEEKKQIKLYISTCWVSDREELLLPKNIELVKKVNKKVLEILAWIVGKVDRWLIWNKFKWFASNNAVDRSQEVIENVWQHRINRHSKVASVWLNPWLVDRFFLMLDQKIDNTQISDDIETVILYSDNDPTFVDPKENAKKLQQIHKNSRLQKLWNAWHGAFAEKPEMYNWVIEKLLKEKFWD